MVGHVLFDADGVVQRVRGGWWPALARVAGDRATELHALIERVEVPMLVGGDYPAALRSALAEQLPELSFDDVYAALWLSAEVSHETLALVRSLRAGGHGVHLGSNQHARRATYMRGELGYDDLFDTSFYSCDLGVAKPDPRFFERVAQALEVPTAEVLFIDDSAANVRGAQEAGMTAVRWTLDEGPDEIRSLLLAHGATLAA